MDYSFAIVSDSAFHCHRYKLQIYVNRRIGFGFQQIQSKYKWPVQRNLFAEFGMSVELDRFHKQQNWTDVAPTSQTSAQLWNTCKLHLSIENDTVCLSGQVLDQCCANVTDIDTALNQR